MQQNISKAVKNRSLVNKCYEHKGMLIVIEGNDGAGKSTLIKYLSKYFSGNNVVNKVVKFNMSYITLGAIKKGQSYYYGPYTNTLLHTSSIVDQLERYVIKELNNNRIIICDRYIYSIIVRAIARGVKRLDAEMLVNYVIPPDYVFYLDINPESSINRLGEKNISFWEAGQDVTNVKNKKESFFVFQSIVRNEFLRYVSKWKFNIINAELSTREQLKEVLKVINKR